MVDKALIDARGTVTLPEPPPRLYGVSSGNGNDGVSHIFADYYVRTNDPWRLARLAMVSQFKPDYQDQALAECDVCGDTYTAQACILEPLGYDHTRVCRTALPDGSCDCPSWSDTNGAAYLVDVFPEDQPRPGRMIYETLLDAFGSELLAKIGTDT